MVKIKTAFIMAGLISGLVACANSRSDMVTQAPTEPLLSQYQWRLVSAVDKDGQALANLGTSLKLNFDHQQLTVTGACNDVHAAYQLNNKQLMIQNPISTRKSCPAGEMAKETALMNFIENPEINAKITSSSQANKPLQQPKLWLQNVRGDRLVWEGVPTPESLYGKPTLIFWQTGDASKPCQSNNGTGRCLRVREVYYNDQGIKTGVGSWQDFTGHIEGWTPSNDVAEVLRLKRYTRQAATATQPANYLYVLDMVVEQERFINVH